jgi:hypothetical protein
MFTGPALAGYPPITSLKSWRCAECEWIVPAYPGDGLPRKINAVRICGI